MAFTIPSVFQNYPVHIETSQDPGMFVVWQKVNGGMRLVSISRSISRIGFWSGVLLYVTEGTKFSKANSNVEIANARPEVQRLFLAFLEEMGLPRYRVRARIQLHSLAEKRRAQSYWDGEIGLPHGQYNKPMLSKPSESHRRTTFTLRLRLNNSMLCALLSYWGDHLEMLKELLDHL